MKYNVYIFGEVYSELDRERVSDEIRELYYAGNIDFLLVEDIGPYKALNTDMAIKNKTEGNFKYSARSYDLAMELKIPVIGIDNWEKKTYFRDVYNESGACTDCSHSYGIRENRMLDCITKYSNLGNCAVIIEDFHLRGTPNILMGDVSVIIKRYLNNPKVSIFHSPGSVLKSNDIVRVEGNKFNKYVYNKLISLGTDFLESQDQYKNDDYFFRRGYDIKDYSLDDFLHPNKLTYCYIVDNTIVSLAIVTRMTKSLLDISTVYTDPTYRNQGFAKELFIKIFDDFPQEKFVFELSLYSTNVNAFKLYEKLGFKLRYVTMGV